MMEVKQNTSVDLSDLLTSSKNDDVDEVDDAVMPDLSDRNHGLVHCELIKRNDGSENIEVENGDTIHTSLKDIDEDLTTNVNSELEDALLEEDDVLPELPNTKEIEQTLSTSVDILAEKAETSNSTTSSNVRDPGDDLDTLLSKINDIVEDCIEKDSQNTVSNTIKLSEVTAKKLDTQEESNVNENCVSAEKENAIDDSKLTKAQEPEQAIVDVENKSQIIGECVNFIEKETATNPDLPIVNSEHGNNVEERANKENSNLSADEIDAPAAETKASNEKSNSIANIIENNIDLEKTDEENREIVQDNKTTSNSNEVSEDIQTACTKSVDNDEMPSTKVVDSVQIDNSQQKNEDSEANMDKGVSLNIEKAPSDPIITSGNVGNDESDDEIVFYVDQPSEIEKSIDTETKSLDAGIDKAETPKSNKESLCIEKKTSQEDYDVVLLLDDDDEEMSQNKKETDEKGTSTKDQCKQTAMCVLSTDESSKTKEKNIVTDESDNARDDFAAENLNEKEKQVDKIEVTQTPEETNSNCSSSSNLLQEAKCSKTVADDPTPEEADNEEDDDDGDVEVIIGDLKVTEPFEKVEDSEITPPAKRIRLSEDDEQEELTKQDLRDVSEEVESLNSPEKNEEAQENLELESSSITTHCTLKRSHDVIELEGDEKSNDSKEGINKKPKTDILKDEEVLSNKIHEIMDDKQSEGIKYIDDSKKHIKAVPSYEPIRLYPAPEFGVLNSKLPMSLDFLKKFRKSFDNMTKQDLEELVLQKVVEAIIHRSEFSEMRELIEKQEKLINAHRTKISELSKQFRDLEMVHNRVVKDIEQRNAQFIMPVKITRAVGLQVYIPNKKSLAEATSSTAAPNIPSSPQRPAASQTSSTSSTSLTPAQRQYLSSQTESQQQRAAGGVPTGPGNTVNVRRGCVQKITPIRPVPGSTPSTSTGAQVAASTAYRNTPNPSAPTQPRILNKNATTAANSTTMQRPRYLGSNQDGQRMATQQQISRTPNIPANSPRAVANTVAQSKSTSSIATTVQRRSEPAPTQSAGSSSSSIVDNYINTLTHLTGGNTAVSITPAKPKEKAVIDLTDEDEMPAQSAGAQNASQLSGAQVPRRSLPIPNSSNSQLQYGRAPPPSLARVPPVNQMTNNKNRPMSSIQAQKNNSFTSISTPPGTSITRINVAPNASNVQRVKYSHPAPLPATPPQAFNPLWKLPPPRPTIRISNLDNGIVISWTMEESMDRHAECVSYQIYAYQETSGPPMVDSWRHVGDVKAMLLPMAVTLTQFQEGQRYYFAVRAVDCHQRYGPFSLPKTWS